MNDFQLTDDQVFSIIQILQRLVWADIDVRKKIQNHLINILPIDFYSNTPSINEIVNSFEYTTDSAPYNNVKIFNQYAFQETIEQLIKFSIEFNPPIYGDENNVSGFFWDNSQFSFSDAMSYYCFIRSIKPSNIVEIGSGFSTLIAIDAIEKNQSGKIHCIEPYPREFLVKNDRINLHAIKAQEIQPEFLNDNLNDNDILFLDSTHTVKTGSDCLHLYLRLIPEIKRDIYIHVHDVYLPFGLPQEWLLNRQIFWTEQYLLLAFLIDNPKTTALWGSNYNAIFLRKLMEKFMGGKYPAGGGSFWFRYYGNYNDSIN